MHARFTRIAVRFGKSRSFVVGYPEIRDGIAVLVTPGLGAPLALRASDQAITANAQTSEAFRLAETGSVYSIAVKDVTHHKVRTVGELFLRNPWQSPLAAQFTKALQK